MRRPVKFNKDDPSTFKYNNERLSWVHPSKDIACYTCKFKLSGEIGYRNGYCEKYIDTDPLVYTGKPMAILFKNAECEFYESE